MSNFFRFNLRCFIVPKSVRIKKNWRIVSRNVDKSQRYFCNIFILTVDTVRGQPDWKLWYSLAVTKDEIQSKVLEFVVSIWCKLVANNFLPATPLVKQKFSNQFFYDKKCIFCSNARQMSVFCEAFLRILVLGIQFLYECTNLNYAL